jgi:hypothetical protein
VDKLGMVHDVGAPKRDLDELLNGRLQRKEKARITAGVVASLIIIVGWFVLLGVILLSVR